MYYLKYRPAKTWKDLGLIGDTLNFTDDPIITSQGIGHSMSITGDSCPMDAAVVYSLLSHGPEQHVTAEQLINQYTRTAYLFEEGMVADGFWKVPKEGVQYHRCEHEGHIITSYSSSSYSNAEYAPALNPLTFSEFIAEVIHNEDSSMLTALLDVYNWETNSIQRNTFPRLVSEYPSYVLDTNSEFRTWLGIDDTSSPINVQIILPKIEDALPDGLQLINKNNTTTHVICGGTDNEGYCDSHNPKAKDYERAWVYKNGLPPLYGNEIISSYQRGRPHLSKYQCDNTHKFEDNRRTLVNGVEDKFLRRCINKSLTRMINSHRVVKTSSGRGRTFQWKAWNWLEEIRMTILASDSMKRKVGDEVNGWIYSKGNIRESHGMEIVTYVWKPKEAVATYRVRINTIVLDNWSNTAQSTNIFLPFIFMSKGEAQAYANTILLTENLDSGIPVARTVDDDFNVVIRQPSLTVKKQINNLEAEGNVVIEEYQEPLALYRTMLLASKSEYDELRKLLSHCPKRATSIKQV